VIVLLLHFGTDTIGMAHIKIEQPMSEHYTEDTDWASH